MIKPASETPEWMEVPPGVTAELNDSRREVVCSVLARRGVRAGTAEPLPVIAVKLGSPDDGLLMRVEQSSTKNERRIPPATGAPELRTNFEHTFDSLMSDFD